MGRTSVADYLFDFERLGSEQAFGEHQGYRTARLQYGQIADLAFRFARELTARGIRKGDRVVLWGLNSAAWVAAFFGCANRGVIAVPMDHAAATDFALRVFRQVDARLLVCSRDHAQLGLPALLLEEFETSLQERSPAPLEPEKISLEDFFVLRDGVL